MMAASSSSGGWPSESPAHSAPSSRASAWASVSSARVKAKTRLPWCRATWHTMCAEAPKPYRPRRSAVAGELQRPVADEAGAEERRRVGVGVAQAIGAQ